MIPRFLPLLAVLPLLAGCGDSDGLYRTLGFTRDAPDEFQVTTRAPLSMPPDFALRPPRPGVTRPQELPLSRQAEATLVPQVALGAGPVPSKGQAALLAAAGRPAPADIRAKVDEEAQLERPGDGIASRMMFWGKDQPGTVIDPAKEQARLQRDTALGQTPQQGRTPIIQKERSGGFWNWLF